MPKQGQTVKQANKALRQEGHRAWLSEKCTLQHLFDNIQKIEALEIDSENFNNALNKYKVANEQRLKLINKYLPELKAMELTGEDGQPLNIKHTINFNPVDQND